MELGATGTGVLASSEFICTTWHWCNDLALRQFRSGLAGNLKQRRTLDLSICLLSNLILGSGFDFHTLTPEDFYFLMISVPLGRIRFIILNFLPGFKESSELGLNCVLQLFPCYRRVSPSSVWSLFGLHPCETQHLL